MYHPIQIKSQFIICNHAIHLPIAPVRGFDTARTPPVAVSGVVGPLPGQAGAAPEPRVFNGIVRNFGAVTVTGRNLYDLMAHGEVALLFPGVCRGRRGRGGGPWQWRQ